MAVVERTELRSKSDGAVWKLLTGGGRGAKRRGLERQRLMIM